KRSSTYYVYSGSCSSQDWKLPARLRSLLHSLDQTVLFLHQLWCSSNPIRRSVSSVFPASFVQVFPAHTHFVCPSRVRLQYPVERHRSYQCILLFSCRKTV